MTEADLLRSRIVELEGLLPSAEELRHEYLVMRLTGDEVTRFAQDLQSKCDIDFLWTQSLSSGRGEYPVLLRRGTLHANSELAAQKRKSNAVVYTASHIILREAGKSPATLGLQASHLCHTPRCLNPLHLVWETRFRNEFRNRCIGQDKCICKQHPSCLPQEHK